MSEQNANGSKILQRFQDKAMVVLGALLLTAWTLIYGYMTSAISKQADALQQHLDWAAKESIAGRERFTRLEERQQGTESDIREIKESQKEILVEVKQLRRR